MSPLEAARRLALYADQRPCPDCNGSDQPHAPACPHLTLPRIVAALEAAEQVADPHNMPEDDACECWYCGALADKIGVDHEPDCPWQALAVALRGDD